MKTKIISYRQLKSIHLVSAAVMMWGMSDALVSFIIPIQVESYVNNLTIFGFLFAFSSLVGSLSDPILGYLSNKIRYTALMFIGLLLSFWVVTMGLNQLSYIVILWMMAAWGLYYEFIEIGIFSYVSHHHNANEQSRYFGIVYLFLNLPYVIGPILGGYLLVHGSRAVYTICMVFILVATLFLPRLIFIHRKREKAILAYEADDTRHYSLRRQLHSFRKVWRYASIFFFAALIYNIWDSFVWTLIPIQSIGGNAIFAGLITSIFTLPLALLSGYGGEVADRVGRHVVFLVGLLVASVFTFIFGLQTFIVWQLITAGIASLGFAFAYPAMMGITSQEGQDHQSELGNMTAVQRVFVNVGFIMGPIIGGFFGKIFGIQQAFTVLGIIMLVCFVPIATSLIHFRVKGRIHKSLEAEFDL